jgi:hypothetical protein
VITVEEMPPALEHLREMAAHEKRLREGQDALPVPEVGIEPHELIGLSIRAQPFIKMLEQALREKKEIVWEAPRDFTASKK